jgi:hypothetical protein
MTNPKLSYDAPYLDDEERETMEALDAAMDRGEIIPPTEEVRLQLNERWQEILKENQERKAITLRLQLRDISLLKMIARRRGVPYQTLVSSVLHQFANGDIIERP